jgi:hypothetical protein
MAETVQCSFKSKNHSECNLWRKWTRRVLQNGGFASSKVINNWIWYNLLTYHSYWQQTNWQLFLYLFHLFRHQSQCGICDANEPQHRQPITNAIDGTHSWWQSPSLAQGEQYEFVTIDIDLGQVSGIFWSLIFNQVHLFNEEM